MRILAQTRARVGNTLLILWQPRIGYEKGVQKMKTIISAVSVLLLLAGCNQAPPAADPSVITSRSAAWEAALNAGDVDALVAVYSDDARLMPPDGPMTTGKDAVRAAFGGMIDAGVGGTLTSVEAMVAGDMGHNIGTYQLTSGGEVVDTGKFVEIWMRGADGEWRIASDIWNSDGAQAAEPMEHTHLMITHEVEDGDRWIEAWRGENSRHGLFEANGAMHVHTFRSPDDPNLTGLVVAVHDMAAIEAMLASEEGKAAAAADGVDLDNITLLIEAK